MRIISAYFWVGLLDWPIYRRCFQSIYETSLLFAGISWSSINISFFANCNMLVEGLKVARQGCGLAQEKFVVARLRPIFIRNTMENVKSGRWLYLISSTLFHPGGNTQLHSENAIPFPALLSSKGVSGELDGSRVPWDSLMVKKKPHRIIL